MSLIENLLISKKANKMYPYLTDKDILKVSDKNKKEITTNVKAMFYHKFGGTVLNSTDNIIISKVISLKAVGLYSNYYLITNISTQLIPGKNINVIYDSESKKYSFDYKIDANPTTDENTYKFSIQFGGDDERHKKELICI